MPRYEAVTNALICSIHENCSEPDRLDIRLMQAWDSPEWSDWQGQPTLETYGKVKGGWVTMFTLFRYAIPRMCNFEGHAIFLDCDMLMLGDACELWDYRKEDKWVSAVGDGGGSGDCVTVMDCSAYKFELEDLKSGKLGNKRQIRMRIQNKLIAGGIPAVWNMTDRYDPNTTKLIHYTSMKTQPWHPLPEAINYEEHADPKAVALYHYWVERSIEWQLQPAIEHVDFEAWQQSQP